ncbi:MAG TPA: response regulator [Stenomitos sp.]
MTLHPPSSSAIAPLILVVDDDPTMRILLKAALEEDNYRVVVAPNGEQGLSQYLNLTPDMVLLDVMLGNMTGLELCAQIRQHLGGTTLPILMLTSLDDQDSIDQAFAAGATDYITKPIHWGVLSKRVERLFEQVRAQQTYQGHGIEMVQIQTWSQLLEQLALAQAQGISVWETLRSLLPYFQSAFYIDVPILLLPPDSPVLQKVQTCPFVRAYPEGLLRDVTVSDPTWVNSLSMLPELHSKTIVFAEVVGKTHPCGFWAAGLRTGVTWSSTLQQQWEFLGRIWGYWLNSSC